MRLFACLLVIEKVLASDCLTVLGVLDLDLASRFRRARAARLLRYDPLHVPVADHAEQVPATGDVLHGGQLRQRSSSFSSRVLQQTNQREQHAERGQRVGFGHRSEVYLAHVSSELEHYFTTVVVPFWQRSGLVKLERTLIAGKP
jgi:hypothetical protein